MATGVVAIRKRLGAIGSSCALIFVPLITIHEPMLSGRADFFRSEL
jgi:hypothetical protein